MEKKITCLLLTLALLLGAGLPARADVIWEPVDDRFYESRREEMTYVNAAYEVAPGGSCCLYQAPDRQKVLDTFEAGDQIRVSYVLEYKGEQWGCTEIRKNEKWVTGWLRINRLGKIYDSADFVRDHSREFVEETIELTDLSGDVMVWTYPNSGQVERTITIDADYQETLYFTSHYIDENGERWGHVGYYMGPCSWVCIDDLYNEAREGRPVPTDFDGCVTEPEKAQSPDLLLVGGLVAGVVVATGIMIFLMKRKSKE